MTDTLNNQAALIPSGLTASLDTAREQAIDHHPAAVYLARLAPGSRRTMRASLDIIAGLLTNGRENALTLAWPELRYQHTQAIRARLAAAYAPATANKMYYDRSRRESAPA